MSRRSKPLTLESIPTYAEELELRSQSSDSTKAVLIPDDVVHKISLMTADITDLKVDAIVNAANSSLLGGGGVDGAIHAAAGPGLLKECRELDGCETGDAKITDGYDLPARKVIHTVGPVYAIELAKDKEGPQRLLQSCYVRTLQLAVRNGCKTVAFCAISTGIYGYPQLEAAEDAAMAVRTCLTHTLGAKIERVIFCCFSQKDRDYYEQVLP
jgi:O-acetyl-ADP-ribose deacetylase (regulator of RNase III)